MNPQLKFFCRLAVLRTFKEFSACLCADLSVFTCGKNTEVLAELHFTGIWLLLRIRALQPNKHMYFFIHLHPVYNLQTSTGSSVCIEK